MIHSMLLQIYLTSKKVLLVHFSNLQIEFIGSFQKSSALIGFLYVHWLKNNNQPRSKKVQLWLNGLRKAIFFLRSSLCVLYGTRKGHFKMAAIFLVLVHAITCAKYINQFIFSSQLLENRTQSTAIVFCSSEQVEWKFLRL